MEMFIFIFIFEKKPQKIELLLIKENDEEE